MNESPAITVLLPNFNNAPFLREAIDSILNQTFSNFILLIVDDGSTDESVAIIKTYTDPRIKLVEKGYNSGIVDTLNIGLDMVSTPYVARMDGDDLSTPDRLETQYRYMEAHPEIGVCSGHLIIYGKNEEAPKVMTDTKRIKAQLIYKTSINHAVSMYRMEVLNRHSIRYTNNHPYMEDYDLFFRMRKYTELINLEKVLYYYRILDHNSTVKNLDTLYERYKNFYKKHVLPELQIEPSEENAKIHAELFLWPSPTHDLQVYRDWQKLLLERNEKLKLYPQEELKRELEEKWKWFFYAKVATLPWKANLQYFRITPGFSFSQLYYLLKIKLSGQKKS